MELPEAGRFFCNLFQRVCRQNKNGTVCDCVLNCGKKGAFPIYLLDLRAINERVLTFRESDTCVSSARHKIIIFTVYQFDKS